MNGKEMAAIRGRLGLDRVAFARLIGYTGTDRNDETRIRKYENDKQQIPLYIARLVWLIEQVGDIDWNRWPDIINKEKPFNILWPEWSGYDFDHTPDYEYQGSNR